MPFRGGNGGVPLQGGVQVISLHCDPIGVDNRSLGAKH